MRINEDPVGAFRPLLDKKQVEGNIQCQKHRQFESVFAYAESRSEQNPNVKCKRSFVPGISKNCDILWRFVTFPQCHI